MRRDLYNFFGAKVGDKVCMIKVICGTIEKIDPLSDFPIKVVFESGECDTFTYKGKRFEHDKYPSLFKEEILELLFDNEEINWKDCIGKRLLIETAEDFGRCYLEEVRVLEVSKKDCIKIQYPDSGATKWIYPKEYDIVEVLDSEPSSHKKSPFDPFKPFFVDPLDLMPIKKED